MRNEHKNHQTVPFKMVGSTVFGRYPKISVEQTFNMIISDDWLVPYAGYQNVLEISPSGKGRGIFVSTRLNKLIVVVDNIVYTVDTSLNLTQIGLLSTFSGDVFIDENQNNQIGICDKQNIYIYNYITTTFTTVTLNFTPGYIYFQDGYFIAPDISSIVGSAKWRLSALNDGTNWPLSPQTEGLFQTKPDQVVACVAFPSKENLLFVMGRIVTELWYDTGGALFPYQRSSSVNIDYGCLNPATIAVGDRFVVWLAANEKSGPVIMYSEGGNTVQISNDGINFKLAELNHPEISYGFLFKQDGHLLYQITFPDPSDNLTYTYDFSTQKFFTLTNQTMDFHIAKKVAFFNNTYYFVSLIDGNLYELDTKFTNYDYSNNVIYEIPRTRVCETVRMPDTSPFITQNLNFVVEQGESVTPGRIDFNVSRDGGQTFGNVVSQTMNTLANRRNRVTFRRMGYGNEMTPQFRFQGFGRFVIGNGTMDLYQ